MHEMFFLRFIYLKTIEFFNKHWVALKECVKVKIRESVKSESEHHGRKE